MFIVSCFVIMMFFALGIIFSKGKGAFLIAGYNTHPNKEKFNEKALCMAVAKLMYALGVSWLIVAVSSLLESKIMFIIGQVVFIVSIIVGVIYLNTGNRFEK